MDPSESAAIASCQAGNLQDFDALYTAYVEKIYGYLSRRIFSREVAEDLTSITFMKALENIGSYDAERGTFQGWLYRIARNSLIDHYRDPARKVEDIENVWDVPSDEFASQSAERKIDASHLHAALQTLKRDQREIVMLRVWEGLSYKEIADITGKSESNCKVIFCRSLKDLRGKLPSLLILLLFPHFL